MTNFGLVEVTAKIQNGEHSLSIKLKDFHLRDIMSCSSLKANRRFGGTPSASKNKPSTSQKMGVFVTTAVRPNNKYKIHKLKLRAVFFNLS
jgi:hypothetical protein